MAPRPGRLTWVISRQDRGHCAHQQHGRALGDVLCAQARRARADRPARGAGDHPSDSLYAINMTTGNWVPPKKGRRNADTIVDYDACGAACSGDAQRRSTGTHTFLVLLM